MYVHVHDIRKSRGLSTTFEYEGPVALPGLKLLGPVRVALKLTNAGSRIVVEGPFYLTLELLCCRCAEPFAYQLETEVEEFFVPEDSPEVPRNPEGSLEEFSLFTFADERIPLDELLRQEAVAAIPMQVLCQSDCQGLCDGCGVNLNKDKCQCPQQGHDPRWDALARLKEASPTNGSKESAL